MARPPSEEAALETVQIYAPQDHWNIYHNVEDARKSHGYKTKFKDFVVSLTNDSYPHLKKGLHMHIQDLILLIVANQDEGDLQGRTILQKKLYFLSVLNKSDHCTDLVFRPHYYGPYSSEVAENLDILVSSGIP